MIEGQGEEGAHQAAVEFKPVRAGATPENLISIPIAEASVRDEAFFAGIQNEPQRVQASSSRPHLQVIPGGSQGSSVGSHEGGGSGKKDRTRTKNIVGGTAATGAGLAICYYSGQVIAFGLATWNPVAVGLGALGLAVGTVVTGAGLTGVFWGVRGK